MKLSSICELFTDGDWIESKDQSESGIRLIQTGNIGEGYFIEKADRKKYISEETFKRLNCTEIYAEDILVSRLPEPVGRACIVPKTEERMITAVDCTICRVKSDNIDKKYLCYYLQSKGYYKQLENSVTGTTRKRISRKNLGNVDMSIPSIDEQLSIVERLDKVKTIISDQLKQLESFDELIKSRFVEMFGNLNNTQFDAKSIEELCVFVKDGTHQTPEYTEDKESGYKFLSSKDVTKGVIDWSKIKYIPAYLHEELYKRISPQKGDLLLAKNGTTGIAAIVDTDDIFDIYVSLALLRFNEGNNVKYLWAAINSDDTQRQFDSSVKGVGVPNLHLGEIKKTKIIVPPINLQNEFATFVEHIDKLKVKVQKSLDETQTLFDSLMQKYFG